MMRQIMEALQAAVLDPLKSHGNGKNQKVMKDQGATVVRFNLSQPNDGTRVLKWKHTECLPLQTKAINEGTIAGTCQWINDWTQQLGLCAEDLKDHFVIAYGMINCHITLRIR